jgi:RND family efflux transporter MFP subunit
MRRSNSVQRLILAGLVAGGVAACQPADGAPPADQEEAVRVVNVQVVTVQPSAFVDYVRATGEVEALSDITVSAEETGVIREFFAAKGAMVSAGQPLARIDDAVLKAQADEARAAAQLAQEQYQRQRQVWDAEKIGSEMGVLQAKSQADGAAARAAALDARLERTVVRAPVAGVFDEKSVEVGEMVQPGTPIARVVATQRVKVTAGIPERFAAEVATGAAARLSFDVFPGREFAGRVSFVGSTVDRESRTFPIEVVLDNPQRLIKPRMVASVQVVRSRLENALVVPQGAVLRTEAGYQAFVVVERDGHLVAQTRPVRLGASFENRVVIEAGLAAGDRLVVVGQRLVDQGSRVRIVQDAEVPR